MPAAVVSHHAKCNHHWFRMRGQHRRDLHRAGQPATAGRGRHEAGGQLSLTTLVENFPGFPDGINGPDLVENMKKAGQHFGAEYVDGPSSTPIFPAAPFASTSKAIGPRRAP